MPRKGPAPKRQLIPDPVYNSTMVTRFINRMLTRGKRSVAERIFYDAMDLVGQRSGQPPQEIFDRALRNAMPERLAGELLDAANNQGASVKRREDAHRMAEANKAFGHFR